MFRLGMGTRGGEASALKWKHLSAELDSVWIGESFSRGTTGSTKTKKARTVNLSASISAMLSTRRDRLNPVSDDELVFKSPEGLPINDRNFCRRAWKTVLAEVGVKYRKPYTTRKTAAISQANFVEAIEQITLLGYKNEEPVFYRAFTGSDDKFPKNLRSPFPEVPVELKTLNENGLNIYLVVNGDGQKDVEVTEGKAIYYEHDDIPKQDQILLWQKFGLPEPTFQVDTGGKSIHSYWVFDRSIGVAEWKILQRDLLNHTNADRKNKNPSRVMRLAGFKHQKTGERSTIISRSGHVYSFDVLRSAVPVEPPKIQAKQAPKPKAKQPESSVVPLENCLAKVVKLGQAIDNDEPIDSSKYRIQISSNGSNSSNKSPENNAQSQESLLLPLVTKKSQQNPEPAQSIVTNFVTTVPNKNNLKIGEACASSHDDRVQMGGDIITVEKIEGDIVCGRTDDDSYIGGSIDSVRSVIPDEFPDTSTTPANGMVEIVRTQEVIDISQINSREIQEGTDDDLA